MKNFHRLCLAALAIAGAFALTGCDDEPTITQPDPNETSVPEPNCPPNQVEQVVVLPNDELGLDCVPIEGVEP